MKSNRSSELKIIGSTEYITIAGSEQIPAKVDTGADTSSVWASNIEMSKDGTLSFALFGPKSPFYTGETISTSTYAARVVRSSHGDEQIRYRVELPVSIAGRELTTTFTLANRSRNNFPVLIGRRTLEGLFLVDVSKSSVKRKKEISSVKLDKELRENPYEFHQKYLKKKGAL